MRGRENGWEEKRPCERGGHTRCDDTERGGERKVAEKRDVGLELL